MTIAVLSDVHANREALAAVRWTRRAVDAAGIPLEASARYLLNPGSVGRPGDGNPRASFGILDLSRGAWRIVRVPYDVEGARARIAAARAGDGGTGI